MKRLCVRVVSVSCGMAFVGTAFAVDNDHVLVRPHGHARSDAAFDTDLNACSPMPDDVGIATRPIKFDLATKRSYRSNGVSRGNC